MKTIELSDANPALAACAGKVRRTSPLILTQKGKPVAALVSLKGVDAETLSLANNPRFLKILSDSRARYRAEGGVSEAEVRRRFLGKKASRGRK